MLSIKVLDVPEIDKRVGSVILGKNPFDVIRSKYSPTDLFVSICLIVECCYSYPAIVENYLHPYQ